MRYFATEDIRKGDLIKIDNTTGNVSKVECNHLNFVVRDSDLVGTAYCPDCQSTLSLSYAFNKLAAAMRRYLHE